MSVWENLKNVKGLNVLNLFAGMEVGRLACERAGVPINQYYSSEIDKYAIQVSKANWPDIIHLGDVTKVYGCTLPDIHLLLGGSPCQGFSFAGKQLNFNDPRSALLFEYVRILKELREFNPNVYFLLENVMMKKEYQDVISNLLGVKPIMINSALVSAQNRKRLYWTNIPFLGQPADKGIVLKDILETNFSSSVIMSDKMMQGFDKRKANNVDRGAGFGHVVADLEGKTNTLISRYGKDGKDGKECLIRLGNVQLSGRGMNGEVYSIEGKSLTLTTNKGEGSKIGCYQVGLADDIKGFDANRRIYSQDGKAPTLISSTGGHKAPKVELLDLETYSDICKNQIRKNTRTEDEKACTLSTNNSPTAIGVTVIKQRPRGFNKGGIHEEKSPTLSSNSWQENNKLYNGFTYRKLTVLECKRLQTVPDDYKMPVSNTQAYKMLGNGWNSETIEHLLLPLGDYRFLY